MQINRLPILVTSSLVFAVIAGCSQEKSIEPAGGIATEFPDSRVEIVLGQWVISPDRMFPPISLNHYGAMRCAGWDFTNEQLRDAVQRMAEKNKLIELCVGLVDPKTASATDFYQAISNFRQAVDRSLPPGAKAKVYVEMRF